jgi:hypothetical protein
MMLIIVPPRVLPATARGRLVVWRLTCQKLDVNLQM